MDEYKEPARAALEGQHSNTSCSSARYSNPLQATMKFFVGLSIITTALAALASPLIEKRAAASDVATIGYAAKAG